MDLTAAMYPGGCCAFGGPGDRRAQADSDASVAAAPPGRRPTPSRPGPGGSASVPGAGPRASTADRPPPPGPGAAAWILALPHFQPRLSQVLHAPPGTAGGPPANGSEFTMTTRITMTVTAHNDDSDVTQNRSLAAARAPDQQSPAGPSRASRPAGAGAGLA